MRQRGIRKGIWVHITSKRLDFLLNMAVEALKEGQVDRGRSYVRKALRLGKKMNVRLPRRWKWYLCRRCELPLVPSVNARVRFYGGVLHITCMHCGSVRRIPLRRKEKGVM